jgi:periplasmic copper chaperone A
MIRPPIESDIPAMRIAFLLLALLVGPGARAGGLAVDDAWIRAAPPGADVMAGYATLRNDGKSALTIAGARSDAFARVELHEMSMQGGVMRMRPLSGIALQPRGEAKLAPGGTHFMLLQPQRALKVGDVVTVELLDAAGKAHPAEFTVREAE